MRVVCIASAPPGITPSKRLSSSEGRFVGPRRTPPTPARKELPNSNQEAHTPAPSHPPAFTSEPRRQGFGLDVGALFQSFSLPWDSGRGLDEEALCRAFKVASINQLRVRVCLARISQSACRSMPACQCLPADTIFLEVYTDTGT